MKMLLVRNSISQEESWVDQARALMSLVTKATSNPFGTEGAKANERYSEASPCCDPVSASVNSWV